MTHPITRFAPSPTGFLHIGSARTALFNWLFARHYQGEFLLRIEDTDRARSTEEAVNAIFNGLAWLGIDYDKEVIFQYSRRERHRDVALQLLKEKKAYYCYNEPQNNADTSAEPIDHRFWRDNVSSKIPENILPTIRLKAPLSGETCLKDVLRKDMAVQNTQLDDMILLRSDGTPTYMLSVVVDDHDMNVTHVIRGDDHLTNAFRQELLYQALSWETPIYAHIPLIHGEDGSKLSKRHGALGIDAYRDMGYLPDALCNYLLRLGWSHKNEEIISKQDAIKWFDLDHVGTSPAKFDFAKLDDVNRHYIQKEDCATLRQKIIPIIEKNHHTTVHLSCFARLEEAIALIRPRTKTLLELASQSYYFVVPPFKEKSGLNILLSEEDIKHIKDILPSLECLISWQETDINACVELYLQKTGIKMPSIAKPLRVALTGSAQAPSLSKIMSILGKEETLKRLP